MLRHERFRFKVVVGIFNQLTVSKFSYSKDRFLVNDHLFDVCKI
jgi:hypothetical protein